ncbi:MAG: DUF4855 domain-containing protein [Bacteroidales bacterium]|nr:DUF4855 domain-containing protein [Bacteroidales bacterium]
MRRLLPFALSVFLAAGCGEENGGYQPIPAVKLTVGEQGHTSAIILVESIFCDEVFVIADSDRQSPDSDRQSPSADQIISGGVRAEDGRAVLTGLDPGTNYIAYGVGRKGDKVSEISTVRFSTGVEAGFLYPYEQGRDGAPEFADITLCPGGGRPNGNDWFTVPSEWDKDRFAPHVSYSDSDGRHWLFEAFLSITGVDPDGKTFGINSNGAASADKASWENLIQYWVGEGGAFCALDEAIAEAASATGSVPPARYAVMMMPDPIQFARFSDKNSTTAYWGTLEGKLLDFSKATDQVQALEWYIDRVRAEFAARNFRYLELAGFYILSEELVAKPDGWNYDQKRWDQILPPVGEYLDSCNEGLYWIPYLGADGTDIWRTLGITYAWLQPNYYWDASGSKPLNKTVQKIVQLGMGMELEFEYSMVEEVMKIPGIKGPDAQGNYSFTLGDVPSLRARFREYMTSIVESGLYGKARIALYSGSNALWQLATSSENDDIAMYLELCRFISENPLRK